MDYQSSWIVGMHQRNDILFLRFPFSNLKKRQVGSFSGKTCIFYDKNEWKLSKFQLKFLKTTNGILIKEIRLGNYLPRKKSSSRINFYDSKHIVKISKVRLYKKINSFAVVENFA